MLPFMQRLFGTASLDWAALGVSALVASIILPVIAAEKAWRARRERASPGNAPSPRNVNLGPRLPA